MQYPFSGSEQRSSDRFPLVGQVALTIDLDLDRFGAPYCPVETQLGSGHHHPF
jgi:hypothetical protein